MRGEDKIRSHLEGKNAWLLI